MTTELIELTEYEPTELPRARIAEEDGRLIWDRHGSRVTIEEPGFRTGNQWRLTSNGWVGVLPVRPGLALVLHPRVPIGNIFRMLEVAYRLKSFRLFDGVIESSSLREFYERLANVLARRVLARTRRGLYRAYLERNERLGCVRGRVNIGRALARPWDATLRCEFDEHTADIEDNQILVAALGVIARSGLCSERVLPTVRRAFRSVAGFARQQSLSAADCLGRLYHRLNEDYQPMHALCRFFLEHAGPTLETGDHDMIPFVVSMPQLFEQFVAEWMSSHLPWPYEVRPQYTMTFGDGDELSIRIDLVLIDQDKGRSVAVLDTKYKISEKPAEGDVEQVVAYAVAQGCQEAILVYPTRLGQPVDTQWGESGVRVRSLWFELGGDLDGAGVTFLETLLPGVMAQFDVPAEV